MGRISLRHNPGVAGCFILLYFTRKMTAVTKLNIIKAIHTLIWVFFNAVIFYLYYSVITNRINKWVWVGIGLILLEGLVLLAFKKLCPVTLLARKYSDSKKDNFDIFLPNWLAKHNKLIYTTLFVIVLIILAYRLITGFS
jgi:hypothetical protein